MTYPIQCNNDSCPENHRCHRFMAEPKENQQYQRFEFRRHVEKKFSPGNRRSTKIEVFGCSGFYSMPDRANNEED